MQVDPVSPDPAPGSTTQRQAAMPRIETWEYIVALLTALALIYALAVHVWRALRKLGKMADLFLGDKDADPPRPSLPEQVASLRGELRDHVQGYHVPAPGSREAPQTNGQRGRHHQ